ncbi:MAG: hypothetical protein Q7S50_00600 [bacterium]|nr:hypothetical protein [bacterium]
MNKEIKRILVVSAGVAFIVLGLIGLALPFLQGFLFMAIGLILLSMSSTRVRTWMKVRTTPYPKLHAGVEKIEAWMLRIIGRVDEEDGQPHA